MAPRLLLAVIIATLAIGSIAHAQEAPAIQRDFVKAVADARDAYRGAKNDMQRGGARQTRKAAICKFNMPAYGGDQWWLGTIIKLGAADDGRGVLAIALDDKISVKTWNNAISDHKDNTLLKAGSRVFESAVTLSEGDRVWFRSVFKRDTTDCIKETSLTLDGSMTQPEFLTKFLDLQKVAPDAQGKLTAPPAAAPLKGSSAPSGTIPYVRNGAAPSMPMANGTPTPRPQPQTPQVTVQPLGSSTIIRQQGQPDVTCSPLGNATVCR